MTLSSAELTKLLDLLDEENLDNSLERLSSQLHQLYSKDQVFKIGMTLLLLLQHVDLLPNQVNNLKFFIFPQFLQFFVVFYYFNLNLNYFTITAT